MKLHLRLLSLCVLFSFITLTQIHINIHHSSNYGYVVGYPITPQKNLVVENSDSNLLNKSLIGDYISSLQTSDGGFRKAEGYPPVLNYTSLALISLKRISQEAKADISQAITFIKDCQNPDGGFGNIRYYQDYDPSTIFNTWLAIKALYEYGELNQIDVTATKTYLTSLQSTDGSWGNTFLSALAVDALYYLGALNEIDSDALLSYIINSPPRGVNYAGSAYLSTPDSSYPDIYSTWAAILILKRLNKLEYASTTKVSEFVASCQDSIGGFRYDPYGSLDPDIYSTYYGIDTIKLLSLNYTNTIKPWDATRYAIIIALYMDDLGDVSYAVSSLYDLEYVIIPYKINANATVVTQGDVIKIDLELRTSFLDPIDEANLKAIIQDNVIHGFSEGNGKYYIYIHTIDLNNGTYNVSLEATKSGYEPMKFDFEISVFKYMYLRNLILSSDILKIHSKLNITIELRDKINNPITDADVRFRICDETVEALELGSGIYKGILEVKYPGHMAIEIIAEKEGYQLFVYYANITVLPETLSMSQVQMINYAAFILSLAIILVSIPPLDSKKQMLIIIVGILLGFVFALVLDSIGSIMTSDMNILSFLARNEVKFVVFLSVALSSLALTFEDKRRGLKNSLGWLVTLILFIVVAMNSGYATYFLFCGITLTALFAYYASPGERDNIIKEMKKNIITWSASLIAFSMALSITKNPYSVAGPLAPPIGIGINLLGYLSLLWFMVYLFVPIMTMSKFVYLGIQGLKYEAMELHRRLTTRRPT